VTELARKYRDVQRQSADFYWCVKWQFYLFSDLFRKLTIDGEVDFIKIYPMPIRPNLRNGAVIKGHQL
jgi:hypothetical protein